MLNTTQKTAIAQKAMPIIFANEGGYTSVNANDNGAVSIGKVQWHAGRAKGLLQTICKKNPANAKNQLGMALYNEVMGNASWSHRCVDADEKKRISVLLGSAESREAQDSLALSDILSYVNKGCSYGLTDENALIYFADGVNQYGTGSSLWKKIVQTALQKGGTLDAMFAATKEHTSNYISRRTKVYNTLKAGQQSAVPQQPVKDTSCPRIIPDRTTIKMIQKWLNDYCQAGLVIDGSFGPKSKKGAVKAIQHFMNIHYNALLVEDGSFGPLTTKACVYVSVSRNNKSDLAFIAQILLYVNGYDPQGLDSDFGKNTEKACISFQKDHALTPDGKAGGQTFKKLVA